MSVFLKALIALDLLRVVTQKDKTRELRRSSSVLDKRAARICVFEARRFEPSDLSDADVNNNNNNNNNNNR
ncbi:hypothetical protein EYF80_041761 [Liparis tanakae]|uniref:Uncharacterized protein n=1 Tax=Liparis tanakae TaxID=230148 RepID=A0A4Z2G3A1_9TELE|nr:hypothetical protein EYF80_041761 [Liparis tanakae]